MDKKTLSNQSQHWEKNFSSKPEMFGVEPSAVARLALNFFKKNKIKNIIELGAGQGRDSIFFANYGLKVTALDYSKSAVKRIKDKSFEAELEKSLTAQCFDVRQKLPFEDQSIDGCFSHMLYCMALTSIEIEGLNNEINRILKIGGINIFTVRNTIDGDYQNGIYHGEDLYESNGFIVHFFSKEKIKKLLRGFELLDISSFEEGNFPRKLYKVTMKKI